MNNHSVTVRTNSASQTEDLGRLLSNYLSAGDVIELIGDLGAGKTQLVRGLAQGINTNETVQSPSFMLQRIYNGKPYDIHHFDFYRLDNPGIMIEELQESIEDSRSVVAIEWARSSKEILPDTTVAVSIESPSETERTITISNLTKDKELKHDFDNQN